MFDKKNQKFNIIKEPSRISETINDRLEKNFEDFKNLYLDKVVNRDRIKVEALTTKFDYKKFLETYHKKLLTKQNKKKIIKVEDDEADSVRSSSSLKSKIDTYRNTRESIRNREKYRRSLNEITSLNEEFINTEIGSKSSQISIFKSPSVFKKNSIISSNDVYPEYIEPIVYKSPSKFANKEINDIEYLNYNYHNDNYSTNEMPTSYNKSTEKLNSNNSIKEVTPIKSYNRDINDPIVYKSPVKNNSNVVYSNTSPSPSPISLKLNTENNNQFDDINTYNSPTSIIQSFKNSNDKNTHITDDISTISSSFHIEKIKTLRENYSLDNNNKNIPNAFKKSAIYSSNESISTLNSINTIKTNKSEIINRFRNSKKVSNNSIVSGIKSDIVFSVVKSSNSIKSEANEDDEKRELLFKFQLLANKNPALVSKYPFTMRSDLKVMKNTYSMLLKHLSVSNRVDNLNTYLLAGFMGCEYIFGKIGFDMEGFSKQQISSMKTYEALLVELGEKEYTPYGMDKWSVEVRLAATLIFNAFWFIIAKSISKKTNFDLLSIFSNNTHTDKNDNNINIVTDELENSYNKKKVMRGLVSR